jgi:hypothetical protein
LGLSDNPVNLYRRYYLVIDRNWDLPQVTSIWCFGFHKFPVAQIIEWPARHCSEPDINGFLTRCEPRCRPFFSRRATGCPVGGKGFILCQAVSVESAHPSAICPFYGVERRRLRIVQEVSARENAVKARRFHDSTGAKNYFSCPRREAALPFSGYASSLALASVRTGDT